MRNQLWTQPVSNMDMDMEFTAGGRSGQAANGIDKKSKHAEVRTILISSTSNTFACEVLEGVVSYSNHAKEWIFKMCPADVTRKHNLKTDPPDGILVVGDPADRPWLAEWKGPVVSMAIDKSSFGPCVHVDQVRAGTLACNYFLKKTFTRLGYVGLLGDDSSRHQRQGFLEAAARAGISAKSLKLADSDFEGEQLGQTLREWRSEGPQPLGVLAANDEVALAICQTCRSVGLTVPNDVALLGVGIRRQCEALCRPKLSSMALPTRQIGHEGARLLDLLMNGETLDEQILKVPPVHIEERESSNLFACDDEVVAKEVAYVREHASEPIGVTELARLAGMSRRSLEKHFRHVLGQSIFHVIRHFQLSHACHLIEHSDRSLDEIVEHTAFSSVSHLTRELKKETGLSPGAFRRTAKGTNGSGHAAEQRPLRSFLFE